MSLPEYFLDATNNILLFNFEVGPSPENIKFASMVKCHKTIMTVK